MEDELMDCCNKDLVFRYRFLFIFCVLVCLLCVWLSVSLLKHQQQLDSLAVLANKTRSIQLHRTPVIEHYYFEHKAEKKCAQTCPSSLINL